MPTFRRMTILATAAIALAFVLAGCQFPGSSPGVSFTSPAQGAYIYSTTHPASVVVKGQLTGGIPDTFSMTLNGTVVTSTVPTSTAFSETLSLADGANTIVVTVTASGVTKSATLDLYYPYLALNDGQAADVVMGQTSFTVGSSATSQTRLAAPAGAATRVGNYLYLPDTGNNRVVGYTSLPTLAAGAAFNILLGKTSGQWTDGSSPTVVLRSTLSGPAGTLFAQPNSGSGQGLGIVDTQNNRVLFWSIAPTSSATLATNVAGQPGYNTNLAQCTPEGLDQPTAAVEAYGKLVIADTGNNRVLIWNTLPTTTPVPAPDLVLGQADLSSCGANRNGTPGADTLDQPSGVWTDGTHLVVADTANNRVLMWNAFPTSNGQPADVVIGQIDKTSGTVQPAGGPTGPTGLSGPTGVASNGNQLFIADTGYNRVVVFDTLPTADGATANRVLGQTDLSGTSPNAGGPISASSLKGPEGVSVYAARTDQTVSQDGFLVVADTGNNRELLYRRPTPP